MNLPNLEAARRRRLRILDPIDRIAEVLFGLIMVLTFTGSFSVAEAGRGDVRAMLIGALGCNLAWGIIDGILYLLGCLGEEGRGLSLMRAMRASTRPDELRNRISDSLSTPSSELLSAGEIDLMVRRAKEAPEPPHRPSLTGEDWLGALTVFFLVVLVTFPVALPFFFTENPAEAMRVSNSIAVAMLFIAGVAFGRAIGYRPLLMGFWMIVVGLLLVGLTITLGG